VRRERADFIIDARLPEADSFEQLWVRQMSDDLFEMCCIPFFLYDIALGDVVRTQVSGGRRHVFERVEKASGRYVFRAYFGNSMHARDETVERLVELGAVTEWSSPIMLAIDAEDVGHAQRIADFLQARTESGHLIYETGRS